MFALATQLVDLGKVGVGDLESELGLHSESLEVAIKVICCCLFINRIVVHKRPPVSSMCMPLCNNLYLHVNLIMIQAVGNVALSDFNIIVLPITLNMTKNIYFTPNYPLSSLCVGC